MEQNEEELSSSAMISAQKRRQYYLRPMKLFILTSMATEFLFLMISICFFSGFKDIFYKIMWTLFFCGIGMGSTMGTFINIFITDQYFNYKAILGTTLLGLIVFGTCNILCFRLDHHFDYYGAINYPIFFLSKGFFAGILGSLINGYLLFSANGQKLLIKMGF
jgi:hypothetical protein